MARNGRTGKIEAVVAGSEAEGCYWLLRGAIAHPPTSSAPPPSKKACHAPFDTVCHSPPQESTGPEVSKPATGIAEQALEAASPAALPALEEALPAHMQPLCNQLGGIKSVQMPVEGCKEEPSAPHATISMHVCKVHLGWGWCVPLVANHSSTQTHSDTTRRVMLTCK